MRCNAPQRDPFRVCGLAGGWLAGEGVLILGWVYLPTAHSCQVRVLQHHCSRIVCAVLWQLPLLRAVAAAVAVPLQQLISVPPCSA